MEAEFKLTVDKEGNPVIEFRYHDRDNSINQKLLGVFVKRALKNGVNIAPVSGYLESGTSNSWENYVIKIDDVDNKKDAS